jgi:hypothetical protein
MTATHPRTSPSALAPVRPSRHGAGRHPDVRSAASALCAVVLVIALAVVALGILTDAAPDGGGPSPIPGNNEPSPSYRHLDVTASVVGEVTRTPPGPALPGRWPRT